MNSKYNEEEEIEEEDEYFVEEEEEETDPHLVTEGTDFEDVMEWGGFIA